MLKLDNVLASQCTKLSILGLKFTFETTKLTSPKEGIMRKL